MGRALVAGLVVFSLLYSGLTISAQDFSSKHYLECNLTALLVTKCLLKGALSYSIDTGHLYFPTELSFIDPELACPGSSANLAFIYKTSKDKSQFYLQCPSADTFVTQDGFGRGEAVDGFSVVNPIGIVDFLHAQPFQGRYSCQYLGRYRVLFLKEDQDEPLVIILNPSPMFKRLLNKFEIEPDYKISHEECDRIIQDYDVVDPDVVAELKRHRTP